MSTEPQDDNLLSWPWQSVLSTLRMIGFGDWLASQLQQDHLPSRRRLKDSGIVSALAKSVPIETVQSILSTASDKDAARNAMFSLVRQVVPSVSKAADELGLPQFADITAEDVSEPTADATDAGDLMAALGDILSPDLFPDRDLVASVLSSIGADAGVSDVLPDVPHGHSRFWHGGSEYNGGKRWVSPSRNYAEGYAEKSGGSVYYVDVPDDHPSLRKSYDDEGLPRRAPWAAFEAPADLAARLRPVANRSESAQARVVEEQALIDEQHAEDDRIQREQLLGVIGAASQEPEGVFDDNYQPLPKAAGYTSQNVDLAAMFGDGGNPWAAPTDEPVSSPPIVAQPEMPVEVAASSSSDLPVGFRADDLMPLTHEELVAKRDELEATGRVWSETHYGKFTPEMGSINSELENRLGEYWRAKNFGSLPPRPESIKRARLQRERRERERLAASVSAPDAPAPPVLTADDVSLPPQSSEMLVPPQAESTGGSREFPGAVASGGSNVPPIPPPTPPVPPSDGGDDGGDDNWIDPSDAFEPEPPETWWRSLVRRAGDYGRRVGRVRVPKVGDVDFANAEEALNGLGSRFPGMVDAANRFGPQAEAVTGQLGEIGGVLAHPAVAPFAALGLRGVGAVANLPSTLSSIKSPDDVGSALGSAGGAIGGAAVGSAVGGLIGGPAGLVVGGAVGLLVEQLTGWLTGLVKGLREFSENLNESNRELAKYNGTLAMEFARLEMADIRRSIERGQNTQDSAARLTRAVNSDRDAWLNFDSDMGNLSNNLGTLAANVHAGIGHAYNAVDLNPFDKIDSRLARIYDVLGFNMNPLAGISAKLDVLNDIFEWAKNKWPFGDGEKEKPKLWTDEVLDALLANRPGVGGRAPLNPNWEKVGQ